MDTFNYEALLYHDLISQPYFTMHVFKAKVCQAIVSAWKANVRSNSWRLGLGLGNKIGHKQLEVCRW